MGSATKLLIANSALTLIGSKNITTFGETTTVEGRRINAVYNFIRDEVLGEHPWTFSQKRVALVEMSRTDQDDWLTATDYAVNDIVYDLTLTKYYKCLIAHTSGTLFATDLAAAKWELYTTWVTGTVYAKGEKEYYAGVEYVCLTNHTAGTWTTDLAATKWVATELIEDMDDNIIYMYYLPTDYISLTYLNDRDAIYEVVGNRLYSDTDGLKMKYTYSNDDPTLYSPQFITALASRLAAEVCFNLTQSVNKAAETLEKYNKLDLPKAMSDDSKIGSSEEMTMTEWEEARL